MDEVLSEVFGAMKKAGMSKVKKRVGGDEELVQRGVEAVLPMIMGGMMKNAKSKEGLEALTEALKKDHDGSVIEKPKINKALEKDGEGILGHVFGEKQEMVEKVLSKKEGMNTEVVANLMKMVAPMVMAYLGKKVMEGGLNADGVLDVLTEQKRGVKKKQSGFLKMAGAILDRDKDGSVMDDLVEMIS